MSTEQVTEEVNIRYISKSIVKAFKSVLKTLFSIFLFYKRKWILFLALIIIGVIGGYFLDAKGNYGKRYIQEIVIEPKYDAQQYIYDLVDNLKNNLRDSLFLQKIDIDTNSIKAFKNVEIKPIIRATDVLEKLHVEYGDKEYFHHIIEQYDAQTLEDERYKNFYKYHRLRFTFRDKNPNNVNISEKILEYIRSNDYYDKTLDWRLKKTKESLDQNKNMIAYIEKYLEKFINDVPKKDDDIIVVGKEREIPTVASLLDRKLRLLSAISKQEELLTLNNQIFNIVETGEILLFQVGFFKKMLVRIPILLVLIVSLLFLVRRLPAKLTEYINS
ncbi:hypothetical protein [Aquimarina sp. 2201CG14-23]|uniref:hypothetical protein n=1 Tax=Aquimarina mycalae TaxID=3040073 RepID=UPI0024782697|nr:hypothetical protein [Aquimarina sp. 2201CG14-23]MDH7446356.1 hypothetical protein [Aquimarina sp. 2201CG14-23]